MWGDKVIAITEEQLTEHDSKDPWEEAEYHAGLVEDLACEPPKRGPTRIRGVPGAAIELSLMLERHSGLGCPSC